MVGEEQKTDTKLYYTYINIHERIPIDHPLRKIKEKINFEFVRPLVAPLYGNTGRKSIDPIVLLKLMFLLFYENIPSERDLMARLPLRIDWLWFCGYDIDQKTPHHSVLSKARRRWGKEAFSKFFQCILQQCIDAGLVDGETVYVDSSMINANAGKDRLQTHLRLAGASVYDRLEKADGKTMEEDSIKNASERTDISETPSTAPPAGKEKPMESTETMESKDSGKDSNLKLSSTGSCDIDTSPRPGQAISPVDPDARVGKKYGESTLGYKDHRTVDHRCGVITSTITTPANVNDDKVLMASLADHEQNTQMEVQTVTADAGYGTAENYRALEAQNKTGCIPHQRHGVRPNDAVSHDKFRYDEKRDCYVCPAGKDLNLYDREPQDGGIRYRADRSTCEACPYFTDCVKSKTQGRQIRRNVDAEVIERADNRFSRNRRRKLLTRRRVLSEGSFADAANNHGFKRARWRSQPMVEIQNLMIAAIQNMRKLLKYASHAPLGAFCFVFRSIFGFIEVLLDKISPQAALS